MATAKAKRPVAKKSATKTASGKKSAGTSRQPRSVSSNEYTQTTQVLIVIWLALIVIFLVTVIAKTG